MDTTIDGTKQTQRQALEQVAKSSGRDLGKLLALPQVEQKLLYLLEWFYQLKTSPDPITHQEIEAWNRLTRNHIAPDEVEAIMRLDAVWFKANSKTQSQ